MESNKKILLIQLYSNGDCLYATAVARQIKTDYPGCTLTWAIADFCKDILAGNPYVDEILPIAGLVRSDVASFRKLKRKFIQEKNSGIYDDIFVTQNMDTNQAFYDGCIRSNILNAYPSPVTVPVRPVLRLSDTEIARADAFAAQYRLSEYEYVVLFEFAPQSGQSKKISEDFAIKVATGIVQAGNVAVILSSGKALKSSHPAILDGSCLSLRETAALTKHCSLLLGCSSGITWISTSDAAKQLPMIQLMDAGARWINPVSRDFMRFGFPVETVIELIDFDNVSTVGCVQEALLDFAATRRKRNQEVPLHFRTTRSIIYNLLCYLEFGAIRQHIRVNQKVYGNSFAFNKEVAIAFFAFPFKLVRNLVIKKLTRKVRSLFF